MRQYLTEIIAVDPIDGYLKSFKGQIIHANSFEQAERLCLKLGRGYLKVIGELKEIKYV